MDSQNSNNSNGVPLADTTAKAETSEREKLETLGCAIEEGVEKISLLGGGGASEETCVTKIEENGLGHEIEGEGEGESGSGSEAEIESESDSDGESSEPESATASSSSSSSSGESSSDSDDDDDKGDGDDGDKMVSSSMLDDDVVDGDDDEAVAAGGGPIRSKNELEDLPPVPPVNATIEPHHQMLPVGVVMSILGAKVIVEGVEKHDPLSEGSILWMTESRKPLGFVDEIFGPVKNPYYVVRYNSENEVPTGTHAGTLISFIPEFADHVLNNKDLYKKGYDASGANDEELSDEVEFSDDEKEEEYRRMQRMAKRGTNDQNPSKIKNNKKKVSANHHVAPTTPNAPAASTLPGAPAASTIPGAPAAPLLDPNCLPFSGIGQGLFGGTTAFPGFPVKAGPNLATSGVWTNGTTLPQQPQSGLLPNAFPTNGMPWYPHNQLPLPGIPFQQQLNLSQGAMLPGLQPNIFAQAMLAQGLVGHNQMTFGLNPPFPNIQTTMRAVQQGFPSSELQSERNLNLHPSTIPSANATPQFHPGASASNGRKTFHGAGRGRGRGRKGWRPAQ